MTDYRQRTDPGVEDKELTLFSYAVAYELVSAANLVEKRPVLGVKAAV